MTNTIKLLENPRNKRILSIVLIVVFISIILFLSLFHLSSFPTVWWDEGWTLSAVRNWLLYGHLGNYNDGVAIAPGIPMRFPVAVPVAISMKIFGIGVWQGRLPGVIFTVLTLALLVYIVRQMYDLRTGIATLLLLLILSPFTFQPIISGRQILAEMPMMFYLLGGYALLWLALNKSAYWGVGAAILFGIGIHAKLQVPPFWLVSIVLAILMGVTHRLWRSVKILFSVALGTILAGIAVYLIQNSIMPGSFDNPELLRLLLNFSVATFVGSVRWKAIYTALIFALPEVLALGWVGKSMLTSLSKRQTAQGEDANPIEVNRRILQVAIWGLGASWMIWYISMSMYWIRYILPPFFIGLIFVAVFISQQTNQFNLPATVKMISGLLFRKELNRANFKALAMIIVFSIALAFAIGTYKVEIDTMIWNPEAASAYLNENIPDGSRVETYESELFFLSPNMNYHFPPDLVSMQLYWRANVDRQYVVNYNPLEAKPDFLVVGPYAQTWGVYDDILLTDTFTLQANIGGYQIYRISKAWSGN